MYFQAMEQLPFSPVTAKNRNTRPHQLHVTSVLRLIRRYAFGSCVRDISVPDSSVEGACRCRSNWSTLWETHWDTGASAESSHCLNYIWLRNFSGTGSSKTSWPLRTESRRPSLRLSETPWPPWRQMSEKPLNSDVHTNCQEPNSLRMLFPVLPPPPPQSSLLSINPWPAAAKIWIDVFYSFDDLNGGTRCCACFFSSAAFPKRFVV